MAKTRSSKRRKGPVIALVIVLIILAALACGYLFAAHYFQSHFYPRTTINGDDVSLKSVEEVEKSLADSAGSYILAVHDRDERVTYIKADQIDYAYASDGSVAKLAQGQDSLKWAALAFSEHKYDVKLPASYDKDKLLGLIDGLDCFKKENITEPQDAYLKNEGGQFEIVPEVQGNKPIKEQVIADIEEAVEKGQTVVTLDDDDYQKPAVTSDDPNLARKLEEAQKYKDMVITYDIEGKDSGQKLKLDGDTITGWISIDDKMKVTVDKKLVSAYVQQLASRCNTYAKERKFKTSAGGTVTIGGGDYGWILDKDAETAQLVKDIKAGQSTEREPCYMQRAYAQGEDDIGSTYIELDYTNQHLYYYKKGKLVTDSEFVSGNTSIGNGSPDGIFKIITLKSPATLVGEDYESDVKYFMPFAYNVGLHDADWRSSFGGQIYKSSGSHGCVNLPFDTAKKIFSTVDIGTPVVAYYRDKVKLKSNNAKVSNAYSYSGK